MQWAVNDNFSLEKLSKQCIWTTTGALLFDYPWLKAKNDWRSVDAHFHERAQSVSLSAFLITAADALIIYRNDQTTFELLDLQDQTSMTILGLWISEWVQCHGCMWRVQGRVRPAVYSPLATSLRSLAIISPSYYTTMLTSTVATVCTDIPSHAAIHGCMPFYYYHFSMSNTFRMLDFMNCPFPTRHVTQHKC